METSPQMRRAVREIREHILRAGSLPVPDEKRETLAEYDLRAAGPGEESVAVDVEVRVRSEGESGAPTRRSRVVEISPRVVVESPDGLRFFAGWNDVGRTFVVWFTDDSLRAIRDRIGS